MQVPQLFSRGKWLTKDTCASIWYLFLRTLSRYLGGRLHTKMVPALASDLVPSMVGRYLAGEGQRK